MKHTALGEKEIKAVNHTGWLRVPKSLRKRQEKVMAQRLRGRDKNLISIQHVSPLSPQPLPVPSTSGMPGL